MAGKYLALLVGIFLLNESWSAKNTKKPNIILIIADDLGYNDIGYHSHQIRTPVLDKLARSGVILENYYVQPVCTPTRSQIMSGRYQIHTGLQHGVILESQPNALPLDSPTLADKMKEAGYNTHLVGKWHLGFYKEEYLPWKRGFDTFYGYLGGSEHYFKHIYGGYTDLRFNDIPLQNETGIYSTYLYDRRAIDIIRSQQHSTKPLFLYLAYQNVHGPLEVPERFENKYSNITDKKRRMYAGMTSALDETVGNVTDALKLYGMWENTIVVFTTDNGGDYFLGGNNWPLRGKKGTLWQGGIHGVGFVCGGLVKTSGVVNHKLFHVSDWFPTLLGRAGANLNGTKELDGFDQWEAIVGDEPSRRDAILLNIDPHWKKNGSSVSKIWDTGTHAGLIYGDFKILTGNPGEDYWIPPPGETSALHYEDVPQIMDYHTGEREHDGGVKNLRLYNIKDDPSERHEISAQHPELVDKMLAMIKEFNDTSVPVVYPPLDKNANPKYHGGVWGPWR